MGGFVVIMSFCVKTYQKSCSDQIIYMNIPIENIVLLVLSDVRCYIIRVVFKIMRKMREYLRNNGFC